MERFVLLNKKQKNHLRSFSKRTKTFATFSRKGCAKLPGAVKSRLNLPYVVCRAKTTPYGRSLTISIGGSGQSFGWTRQPPTKFNLLFTDARVK